MRRVLTACAALVCVLATPASAAEVETIQFSADLVDALAAAGRDGKPAPRMRDPAWAPRFQAALDPTRVAQLDRRDLLGVINVCQAANRAVQAYLEFGVKNGNLAAPTVESGRAMMANTRLYQDEVAVSVRFAVACFAVGLEAAEDFTAQLTPADLTPERKNGAGMMRDGIATMYIGVVQSGMGVDNLTPANRDMVLDVAVANLDVFSRVMRPSDRLKVRNMIDVAMARTALPPDVKAKLQKIRVAMLRTDCVGLCAV